MCGIAGFWDPDHRLDAAERAGRLARMTAALRHRGPDGEGAWIDREAGVALGHRRLAVIDLSPAGAQPMASACGRWRIVFNGEIYNFEELRAALQDADLPPWRGHSDTEVLLAAIARWGLRDALGRTVGMFAFALWDAQERCLSLARDRLGEKPLYYGWRRGVLLFGSELKALRAFDGGLGELDREALAEYLRVAYVPAPRSIHAGIGKLPAAHYAVFRAGDRSPAPRAYWSFLDAVAGGPREVVPEAEAAARLEDLLRTAVRGQMVADVPLGAFLSGGVDSSAVVALMQAQSPRPVRTFSIGFDDPRYDESVHARAVAAHLGTEHTELILSPQQALDVVPRLPQLYDEPFGDSSQIPTFLVSELARRHVTVALSGDGGDELFGGYNRHAFAERAWPRMHAVPRPLRQGAAALAGLAGGGLARGFAPALDRLLPGRLPAARLGELCDKLADVLPSADLAHAYRRMCSLWPRAERLLAGQPVPAVRSSAADPVFARLPLAAEAVMAADLLTYLPDDILVKVDRAAMAVSLETRVPLLDHRVVEFAWRLPLDLRVSRGRTKRLLRTVLYRHVPPALIERPKQGFSLPLDAWLRGPLRPWAEELLSPARLGTHGLLDAAAVRRAWADHLAGRRSLQHPLWVVLMLQAWLETNRDGSDPGARSTAPAPPAAPPERSPAIGVGTR